MSTLVWISVQKKAQMLIAGLSHGITRPATTLTLLSTSLHKGHTASCTGTERWHWA